MRRETSLRRLPQSRPSNTTLWEKFPAKNELATSKDESAPSSSGSSGDNVSGNDDSSDDDARNRKCHSASTWSDIERRMTRGGRHEDDGGSERRNYPSDRRASGSE